MRLCRDWYFSDGLNMPRLCNVILLSVNESQTMA